MASLTKNRIESIDILRGIVMVIMALYHVRDYFHIAAFTDDPLNLATTTPFLFFTRWITHFCAPTFVFLSGTSVYLQSLRKTKKELSAFLIKRGLWLVFAEIVIVSFGWSFDPYFNTSVLQVIWAIGISMTILGLLIYLPFNIILALGLLIVFTHNILDIPESAKGFKAGFWWDLLHHGTFINYSFAPNYSFLFIYPFMPWTGLMILGYCAGIFYTKRFSVQQRKKILTRTGLTTILFFVVLRFINSYGDPVSWSTQKTGLLTFFSFINVQKYPPSLLYMCITIGSALMLLAFLENRKNGFTNSMHIFGRVAFFYYIAHLYLVHLLAVIGYFANGHTIEELNMGQSPFYFVIAGEGSGLDIVYSVWVFVIIALYPLCKWYDNYKTNHKEKWWLSYL